MKLIVEQANIDDLVVLNEATENGDKIWKITGPFMQTETKNRNGRVYKKELMEREVNKYIEEKVKTKRSFGELEHPPTAQISLDRVSHLITDLKIEGNDIIGTANILDTPTGRTVQALLKGGVKLGVSSRGVGELSEDNQTVSDNYQLIAVDIVGDPSALNAYVDGIYEHKEFIIKDNEIVEVAIDALKKSLDTHGSKQILEDLKKFLSSIRL